MLQVNYSTYEAASYACKTWHYSKSIPAGKLYKIGIWEENIFVGVILFGRGANKSIGSPYGLKQDQICELVRVALAKHKAPVTKLIKIAIKMLKKDFPNIRLIVSFADSNQGHIGTIYQAGNWIYTGNTGIENEYYYKGKWRHRRTAHSLYGTIVGLPKRENGYRLRYIFPLDKKMHDFCTKLALPYPKKCAASIVSDATGVQPVEGGAVPTAALQEL